MKKKLLGLFSISILTILGICALEKTTNAVIGSGNGYMLTLTQSNGGVTNSSGYNSNNTSAKTALGNTVYFAYENCIKSTNGDYKTYFAQMRASTGTFYNTSPILGITDITVNFKSNASLSLYTSFTSNDTSGDVTTLTNQGVSTLATVKKTFTNNPTYFTLKAGSAVTYIESILVNYTCLENNDPSSEDPSSETPSSSEEEITISSVSIVGNLSKTSYVEGDSWDLSGLSLQVNYSNSTNKNLGALTNIDDLEYELSPSVPTVGNTSLRIFNIKYQGISFTSAERTFTGITVASSGSSEPENNKTIRFELGQDGASSHVDGNTSKSTYSETNGNYTLSLTGGTNMYPSSRDAKGNGAIKLGSSSKTGGFNFTVPSDVNSVNLEVGKYKANTSIITLNGQQHTLTKSSNDGEYDVFTVDTSTNKNISLTTVTGGVRAMVNAIEYVVGGQGNITPEPEEPETSTFVGIQIKGDMTQKTYNEGDSWNLAGLSLYGVYSDESTAKIDDITKLIGNDLFDYEVDPSNATKEITSISLHVLYQQDDEIYETKKTITSIVVNSIEEPSEPSSTVNATLTFDNKTKRTEYSSTIQVWKENGVTFTNNKNSSASDVADYAAPVRLYAGSDIIVEVDGQISEISFDCYHTSYANALENSISESSVSNDKVTVSNLNTDKFIVASLTAQVRLDALTVTYTSTGGGNSGGNETPDVNDDVTNSGSYYSPNEYSYKSGMENYNNLEEYGYYDCDSAPSTGNVNVLVVPIAFTNSTADTNQVINDLDTVFNGTEEETGWESVSSFFKESSYGELNLSFTVAPTWYQYEKTASYMGPEGNEGRTSDAVDSAVSWYKQTYNTSCKEFDSDSNGYIDCVFLVYAEKDYQVADSSPNNFWAYTFWTRNNNKNRTSPNANTYIWMSYDFMYGNMNGSEHIDLDAHTFIHEYGHAMGLDDYYDYGGNECSAGGFDMQDMNVGDHNPYSKMALGWTKPYIVNGDATITIKPASKYENQTILIPARGYSSWNKSPFDEYILIEYFTAEGLNKFDVEHQTYNRYPRGTSTPGLRVYHIDARLCYHDGDYYLGYAGSVSSSYYYEVAASNTSSGDYQSAFAPDYRLVHLLSQSGTDYMKKGSYMDEYDLFLQGDSFSMTSFKSYFYNSGKLNDGSNLGFTFTVKNITSEGATIEFKAI